MVYKKIYSTNEENETNSTTAYSSQPDNTQALSTMTDPLADDNHDYIFVGDSRYVAMREYFGETDTFVCENGVGKELLSENLNNIADMSTSNTRIIVGLGVNDVFLGIDEYVSLLNQLDALTDAQIYYMLINPVDEALCASSGYALTNSDIDSFNQAISSALSNSNIKVIDTNTYLNENGYTSYDGLHYDEFTTRKIYSAIKEIANSL